MLKKSILLSLTLIMVAVGLMLLLIAPYHIYTLTLTEGVSTQFLVMKPAHTPFYDGYDFNSSLYERNTDNSSLFSSFHFSNFEFPMPLNNPLFYIIPKIKIESSAPRLGASFIDGKNVEIFSYMIEKTFKLETISGDQKLFRLPVFKNHIARKSQEEVWRDLFSKKLSLPSNVGKGFFESLLTLKTVTYSDLVYNLFILYNRMHLFPNDLKKISYDVNSNHGLIELPSEDSNYTVERIYIIDKEIIYSLTIKSKNGNLASEELRKRILKEIIYKNSTIDSAIPIYAHYKNVTYNNRIDQQGMTYLFSAWSHDLSNREYIRVIILFLERGNLNLKYLKPFYEYAYKRFGSNLSSGNDSILESANEKLKRRIKEDLENEVKAEEQKNNPKYEGAFSSPDEKIKFYLQKAKEGKINSDESDKILLQE
jgi:hypothetical protein